MQSRYDDPLRGLFTEALGRLSVSGIWLIFCPGIDSGIAIAVGFVIVHNGIQLDGNLGRVTNWLAKACRFI